MNNKMTVIMPCSGDGSRLNIWFEKELFPLRSGETIIDIIMNALINSKNIDRVVFIINGKRNRLVNYLHRYKEYIDILFIYGLETPYKDVVGSIYSAAAYISKYNLLIFPDTIIESLDYFVSLISEELKQAEDNFPVFLAKQESNKIVLQDEGVLQVVNDRVVLIGDKLGNNFTKEFNAIWCGIAFKKNFFEKLVYILNSTINYKCVEKLEGKVIWVEEYIDLGEWNRIKKYYGKN